MKKTMKKLLTIVSAIAVVLGMNASVFSVSLNSVAAAEDIVLDDAGSPFIRTFDPGNQKKDYQYLGYAYCFEVGPEYKYLKITYTGDKTAFDELRLEFVVNSDPSEEIKLPPCWFRENPEGTIRTVDGELVPDPSDKPQTVVIDLEKSLEGQDISNGIRAFHIHDTPGYGTFKITDARLMTSPEGEKGDGKASTDDKGKDSTDNDNSKKNVEIVTDDAKGTATGTAGSIEASSSSFPVWPVVAVVGAIVVAVIAVVISKSKKEKKDE